MYDKWGFICNIMTVLSRIMYKENNMLYIVHIVYALHSNIHVQ